ncbi:MAG: acetolactate synthase catalytic subunit [Proteobacteria bacterium]|nr:acetolactate synthase catalytic subunit [Pseudomonadota bacterium]
MTTPSGTTNLSAAQAFGAALKRHGITVMFGQSNPPALFLAAADFGIEQITYRTENAGAIMADGYARASGRVPVVTAQNGPAATLLVPGLAEAYKASIPMVALVQDLPRPNRDRNAFQEIDEIALYQGVSKWLRRIDTVERIDDYIDMAFTAAASGRPGPAVLLAPWDLIDEPQAPGSPRTAELGQVPLDRTLADPARIDEAAQLLAEAERPLICAGGGVHSSKAWDELARLQELAGLPVATTTMGKGAVDERHPLSIGVIGYFMGERGMTKFLKPMVEEADVILLVGNRTNQNGTDSWQLFPPGARFIHLDIDGNEVGRNYEALRLVGDAKLTLAALSQALEARDLAARRAGRAALEAQIAEGRAKHEKEARAMLTSEARPIRPERLMAELDALLRDDDIVVADASYASIWVANYLKARRGGQRFLTPRGMAGLGWGLPLAIGAKLAKPEARVFCLTGDGGFAHCWSELETVRRHGLKIVLTVLNNGTLAYQGHAEDVWYGRHTSAIAISPIDHAMIAHACGLNGIRVEEAKDYRPALEEAAASDKTTLIDVITDPRASPPITMYEGKKKD